MLKDRIRAFFSWVPGIEPPVEAATRQPHDRHVASRTQSTGENGAEPELQNIKGIGPRIVKKLDALGIRTYAELAAAYPDTLAEQLDTRPVTPQKVRGWAAEAKKRAH